MKTELEKIIYLDFADFKENFAALKNPVYNILENGCGACVIKNFPSGNNSPEDYHLIQLSELLGEPINEKRNVDEKTIYRVEVNQSLELPTYANTPYEFTAHSDCAIFPNPPDTVILLCERQSDTGGESYIVTIEDILEQLSFSEVQMLSQPLFPLGANFYPILSVENAKMIVRYNRVTIDIYTKSFDLELGNDVIELLDKLDKIIDNNKFVFRLEDNDCLITNNKTLLHGRGSFPENSKRLLKRVRLNLHSNS